MRTLLAAVLLSVASLTANAQVAVSDDYLEMEPMTFHSSGENWRNVVVFYNNTDQTIPIYGLAANGPFDFEYLCDGAQRSYLPPNGSCRLSVFMREGIGTPAGYHPGQVAFRLGTGNVVVDLAAFVYSVYPKTATKNMVNSLTTLGLPATTVDRLRAPALAAKNYIWDAYSSNDYKACAPVRAFIARADDELFFGRMTRWERDVLVRQAREFLARVRCCN